ncbi:MAG: S-layer homology domain-containing protein [Eubacterium sp.]|nr:S-layer homology domain-containing protein [Eubacterium sp.]
MRSIKKGISILLSSAMMIGTFAAGPVGSLGNVYAEGADSAYEIDADDEAVNGIVTDDLTDDVLGEGDEACELWEYPGEIKELAEGTTKLVGDVKYNVLIPDNGDQPGDDVSYSEDEGKLYKFVIPAKTVATVSPVINADSYDSFKLFVSLEKTNSDEHFSDVSDYHPSESIVNGLEDEKVIYVWWTYYNEPDTDFVISFTPLNNLMMETVVPGAAVLLSEGENECDVTDEVQYVEHHEYYDLDENYYDEYRYRSAKIYKAVIPSGKVADFSIEGMPSAEEDELIGGVDFYENLENSSKWFPVSPDISYSTINNTDQDKTVYIFIYRYDEKLNEFKINVTLNETENLSIVNHTADAKTLQEGDNILSDDDKFIALYPVATYDFDIYKHVISNNIDSGVLYKVAVPAGNAVRLTKKLAEGYSDFIAYEAFDKYYSITEMYSEPVFLVNDSSEEATYYLWWYNLSDDSDGTVINVQYFNMDDYTYEKAKSSAKVLKKGDNSIDSANDSTVYFYYYEFTDEETGYGITLRRGSNLIYCKYTVPAGTTVSFKSDYEYGSMYLIYGEGEGKQDWCSLSGMATYSNGDSEPKDIYLILEPDDYNAEFTITATEESLDNFLVENLPDDVKIKLEDGDNLVELNKSSKVALCYYNRYGSQDEEKEYRIRYADVFYFDVPKGKMAKVTPVSEDIEASYYFIGDLNKSPEYYDPDDENDDANTVINTDEEVKRVYLVVDAYNYNTENKEINLKLSFEDAGSKQISAYADSAAVLTEGKNSVKSDGAVTAIVKDITDGDVHEEGYKVENGKLCKLSVPSLSDTVVRLNFKGKGSGYRLFKAFRDLDKIPVFEFEYYDEEEYFLLDFDEVEEDVPGVYYLWWASPKENDECEIEIEFFSKKNLAVSSDMAKGNLEIGINNVSLNDPDKLLYVGPSEQLPRGSVGRGAIYKYTVKPGETLYADVIANRSEDDYSGYYNVGIVKNGELIARFIPGSSKRFSYSVGKDEAPVTLLFVVPDFEEGGSCGINLQNWPFNDVPQTTTGANEIADAYVTGIVGGISTDANGQVKYKPGAPVNRAQFAIMLYNMAFTLGHNPYRDDMSNAVKFRDVSEGSNYYEAVRWASSQNIITGYKDKQGNNDFKPLNPITRQQMALLFKRFADKMGMDTSARDTKVSSAKDYKDFGNEAFVDAASWASAAGVLSGFNKKDGYYVKPADGATRAQTAMFISRFMKLTK